MYLFLEGQLLCWIRMLVKYSFSKENFFFCLSNPVLIKVTLKTV